MGFLDIFRPRNREDSKKVQSATTFQTITEYNPVFSTWDGQLYEKALTRAAVEKSSVLASKLKPQVIGSAKPRIRRAVETAPNKYMTWPKMIGRLMTIMLRTTPWQWCRRSTTTSR